LQRCFVSGRVPAEGLQHAPDAVVEVEAECAHRHDIEDGDRPHGKRRHHVLVDREVLELPRPEPDDTPGQVPQVANDEGNQEHSGPAHHSRGECRLDISFDGVSNGSRSPAHARELDRGGDVKRHAYEQDDPDKPEELPVAERRGTHFAEELRVRVDLVRPGEYLEITEHVADHEADKHEAGDRHDDLLADHGAPEGHQAIAGHHASRHRATAEMHHRIQMLRVLHTHLHSLRCFIAFALSVLGKRGSTALL
jgi:hypothetical protein